MPVRTLQPGMIIFFIILALARSEEEFSAFPSPIPAGEEAQIPSLPHSSLAAFTGQLYSDIPRTGSEAFIPPEGAQRQAFFRAVRELLQGYAAVAVDMPGAANYEVCQLEDEQAART